MNKIINIINVRGKDIINELGGKPWTKEKSTMFHLCVD